MFKAKTTAKLLNAQRAKRLARKTNMEQVLALNSVMGWF